MAHFNDAQDRYNDLDPIREFFDLDAFPSSAGDVEPIACEDLDLPSNLQPCAFGEQALIVEKAGPEHIISHHENDMNVLPPEYTGGVETVLTDRSVGPSPSSTPCLTSNLVAGIEPGIEQPPVSSTFAESALTTTRPRKTRRGQKPRNSNKELEKALRQFEKRQETAHREAKRMGAPKRALDVICFDPMPLAKRKNLDEKLPRTKSACLYCILRRKKCSGGTPCDPCRKRSERLEYQSTGFKWTCSGWYNIDDLWNWTSTFEQSRIKATNREGSAILPKKYGHRLSCRDHLRSFVTVMDRLTPLLSLLDLLEGNGVRTLQRILQLDTERSSLDHGQWFLGYFPLLARWRKTLLFVQPALEPDFAILERDYHKLCPSMYRATKNFDSLIPGPPKIYLLWFLLEMMGHIREAQLIDPLSVATLENLLKTMLMMTWEHFLSRLGKNGESNDEISITIWLFRMADEMSRCIPPHRQTECEARRRNFLGPRLLLQVREKESQTQCAVLGSDECFCGKLFYYLPIELRWLFDTDLQSFTADFHPIDLRAICNLVSINVPAEHAVERNLSEEHVADPSGSFTNFFALAIIGVFKTMEVLHIPLGKNRVYRRREILATSLSLGLVFWASEGTFMQEIVQDHMLDAVMLVVASIMHRVGSDLMNGVAPGLCDNNSVAGYAGRIVIFVRWLHECKQKGGQNAVSQRLTSILELFIRSEEALKLF